MRGSVYWHSIQFKLTATFLIIILPLVMISVIANIYSQRMMIDQITERTKGGMLTTLEYVDQFTKNMDQQTLLINSNPEFVSYWKNINDPLHRQHLFNMHLVQKQLTTLINVNDMVKEAFIIHGESEHGISTSLGGLKWPGVNEEKWFKSVVEEAGGLVLYSPDQTDELYSKYLKSDYIYYARLLDMLQSNYEPNILVIAVEKQSIKSIVSHLQSSDGTGITLYYKDRMILESEPNIPAKGSIFRLEESINLWGIRLEQPNSELFKEPYLLEKVTYFIVLISILLAICLSWLVNSEIAKPLRQLLIGIRQFSLGNLSTSITHKRKDEFGYIMNAFNRMALAQRHLIEEDYEKELKLAQSEFSLLQSKINPHFLYNTLDSIYSVAMKYQIKEISEMVLNLAHFFRSSLGKGRETFTVEETIQHLLYYIKVQQIRMENFTVEMRISEESKDLPILKLLLQPLVENAIVHGIGKSPYGGDLFIQTEIENHYLKIIIKDTGRGFDQKELEDIRKELGKINDKSYRYVKENTYYFGLKNVKSRIKLYYGNNARLNIESKLEEGTVITLLLPITKGDFNEVIDSRG